MPAACSPVSEWVCGDRIVQIRHRRSGVDDAAADQRRDFGTGDALLMVVGLAADNAGDLRDRLVAGDAVIGDIHLDLVDLRGQMVRRMHHRRRRRHIAAFTGRATAFTGRVLAVEAADNAVEIIDGEFVLGENNLLRRALTVVLRHGQISICK